MAKLMLGVDEDMTWDAYLKQNAKNQLIQMTVLNKAAKDAGFEFTDDMQAQVDKNMDQLASYAKQKGVSTAAYLKNVYGKNMTTSVFKKLLTEGIYVSAYDQSYQNDLSYTDDQIAAYYADNKNDFDVVNYEYILFKGTADSTKDDSGNTVQPTDEQNAGRSCRCAGGRSRRAQPCQGQAAVSRTSPRTMTWRPIPRRRRAPTTAPAPCPRGSLTRAARAVTATW